MEKSPISEDLTTTARVKTISKAHPDFTIDLCLKDDRMIAPAYMKRREERRDFVHGEGLRLVPVSVASEKNVLSKNCA